MIDKNDLDDIFGIPQDGSHLDDDSGSTDDVTFGNLVSQNAVSKSFDDQIGSLKKDMSGVKKVTEPIKEDLKIKDDINSYGGENNELQTKQIRESAPQDNEDSSSRHSKTNNEISAQSVKSLGSGFHKSESISDSQVDVYKEKEKGKQVKVSSIIGWNIKTNNLTFSSFYEMKEDALGGWLLPGGEIDFLQTHEELVAARVDLSTIEFGDLHSMFNSLKNVQHWKDRVTEISLRVNAQYYSWKRAVDLFRGTLARMYYEKPAEKQDGVVMEHMGDMIRYFSQLEALHANVDAVVRNLDNAFDCISRQITVSMPQGQREADTVEKRVSKTISSSPVEHDPFADIMRSADSLPNKSYQNANKPDRNSSTTKKIGTIDWNSL